jgi:hypothetical protein
VTDAGKPKRRSRAQPPLELPPAVAAAEPPTGARAVLADLARNQKAIDIAESPSMRLIRELVEQNKANLAANTVPAGLLRTYPEIALEAQQRADAARAQRVEIAQLPKAPSGEELAIHELRRETSAMAENIAGVYDAIKLQTQIGERQEAALTGLSAAIGTVVGELVASRMQAQADGLTIKRLTIALVVLTAVIAVFTVALVLRAG